MRYRHVRADIHRSNPVYPAIISINCACCVGLWEADDELFWYPDAASGNWTPTCPAGASTSHLSLSAPTGLLRWGLPVFFSWTWYLQIIPQLIWHTAPLFHDLLGCWMEKWDCIFVQSVPSRGLNWHSSLVRAVLRVQWSIFVFDEILVSDFNYISLTYSFIWNDEKIP